MSEGHILLVEDNSDDEILTLRSLKKSGVANEVRVARDGAEALALLADDSPGVELPALILLDLNLPKIDGLEVLRRLRSESRTRLIPVVILTSSKEQHDIAAGYSCGANAYVRKPVNSADFAQAVHALSLFWLILSELPPPILRSS